MPSNAFVSVVVPAGAGPTADLLEDYTTYTDTADFKADPRNIYRAGEDKGINNQFLDPTNGINGGPAHECRYPASHGDNFTLSRAFDLETLFGVVTEVWWEMTVKFVGANGGVFTHHDPNNPGGSGFKWMFGSVKGPNSGRFDLLLHEGQNQNRAQVGWPGNPQGPYINGFDCTTMYSGQQSHTFQVHYKVNVPIGTANGRFACILPNGVSYNSGPINVSRTHIFKASICENMNEQPVLPATQSVFYQRNRFYLSDPGWGI